MMKGWGLDCRPTGLVSQGYDKVIARSWQGQINTKQVKIALFFLQLLCSL